MTVVAPSAKSLPQINSELGPVPSIVTSLPGPKAQALIDRDERFPPSTLPLCFGQK